MINKKFNLIFRKIILLYIFVFPGKLKFKKLSSLNFKIIDFTDYSKK